MFSMPETTCYILDGKKPVPCHDIDVWQKFMDDIPGRTVAFDIVGTPQVKTEIRTTFMGVNIGTATAPKFFKMTIVGGNEGDPPIWTESWERAEAKHKGMVKAASGFYKWVMDGGNADSGFRCIHSEVGDNEIRFWLESEESAIEALPKNSVYWSREGNVLIFRAPSKNSAADCD